MAKKLALLLGESLHHDFCPWANAYVYWLKRPTGWLAIALFASLLLGMSVSPQAFLITAVIAALGIVGSLWPWLSMLGMTGRLSWPVPRCEEGEVVQTELSILHRWPWPAWGIKIEADDAIASHVGSDGEAICLSRVPAASRSAFEWSCRPTTRGRYPHKQVRLSTAFPFGIWTSSRALQIDQSLVVWPRTIKLLDVPEHSGSVDCGIGTPSERIGDEGDWTGVRPYRPGDSLRQVAWAQTSRRDSLVVFERQARSRQFVSIWFDSHASSIASQNEREWMVRILASIATHFLSHSWFVQVNMDGTWTKIGNQLTSKHQWMDSLAEWKHQSFDSRPQSAPIFREGLRYCISTTLRFKEASKVLNDRDRAQTSWVLVETDGANDSTQLAIQSPNTIVVDVQDDPAVHLQTQWQSICRRMVQTSVRCG